MSGNYGLEKFSHLEDKIYRTIEQIKRERQQRETLERELASLRSQVDGEGGDKERLESLERELSGLRGQVERESADKERLESLGQEVSRLRKEIGKLSGEKERVELQLRRVLGERHKIKHKVEGMLDTINRIGPEAEAAKR